jgi:hypothetical protein
MTRIPQALRQRVHARARGRCEYCQASERLTGLSGEIDHVMPRARGGLTTDDNLCLACAACNGYKGASTHAVDPESGEQVALFNPRRQNWREHFAWSEDGTRVIGLTACGRATVVALRLNHALTVAARSIWVSVGQHPPKE